MNGVQHTIIGVAPERFHGTFVGYSFSFWVPTSMQETFDTTGYKLEDRGARWIEGYAILKPGVSRQQAQAELNSISQRLEKDFPDTDRGHENELVPLWKTPFNGAGNMSSTLAITMAVVFLVLLIACANVSNLLLARVAVAPARDGDAPRARRRPTASGSAIGDRRIVAFADRERSAELQSHIGVVMHSCLRFHRHCLEP